jgi:hypothetical protein
MSHGTPAIKLESCVRSQRSPKSTSTVRINLYDTWSEVVDVYLGALERVLHLCTVEMMRRKVDRSSVTVEFVRPNERTPKA